MRSTPESVISIFIVYEILALRDALTHLGLPFSKKKCRNTDRDKTQTMKNTSIVLPRSILFAIYREQRVLLSFSSCRLDESFLAMSYVHERDAISLFLSMSIFTASSISGVY